MKYNFFAICIENKHFIIRSVNLGKGVGMVIVDVGVMLGSKVRGELNRNDKN